MSYQSGVDYYPEHWPRERWPIDARMMREMGIQVVRGSGSCSPTAFRYL